MKTVAKKVNLPLFEDPAFVASQKPIKDAPKKPSIDAARARLGGRIEEIDAAPGGFAPGVVVTFASSAASSIRLPGVVVFASKTEVHVLLDGVRLRRFPPSDVRIHEGGDVTIELELEKIAGDARLFGQLVEGQAVRYADEAGGLVNGKVVEKCRWGALVLRDDGAVVAVGFRKLWPAPSGGAA
ncbi:MAG TPA: hypothetical protein VM925_06250 [Labilithrix sp.]|nr:hypothetical protein [Labilithrix sp.]